MTNDDLSQRIGKMTKPADDEDDQHEELLPATAVSGYVSTPIPKRCNTCEHFEEDGSLCNNDTVAKDKQVPTNDQGQKMVDGEWGCCNEWEAEEDDEEDEE